MDIFGYNKCSAGIWAFPSLFGFRGACAGNQIEVAYLIYTILASHGIDTHLQLPLDQQST